MANNDDNNATVDGSDLPDYEYYESPTPEPGSLGPPGTSSQHASIQPVPAPTAPAAVLPPPAQNMGQFLDDAESALRADIEQAERPSETDLFLANVLADLRAREAQRARRQQRLGSATTVSTRSREGERSRSDGTEEHTESPTVERDPSSSVEPLVSGQTDDIEIKQELDDATTEPLDHNQGSLSLDRSRSTSVSEDEGEERSLADIPWYTGSPSPPTMTGQRRSTTPLPEVNAQPGVTQSPQGPPVSPLTPPPPPLSHTPQSSGQDGVSEDGISRDGQSVHSHDEDPRSPAGPTRVLRKRKAVSYEEGEDDGDEARKKPKKRRMSWGSKSYRP